MLLMMRFFILSRDDIKTAIYKGIRHLPALQTKKGEVLNIGSGYLEPALSVSCYYQ